MHRLECGPTAESQRRADCDAIERYVEIGARKRIAVDVASYDGGASADCLVDLLPVDLLGTSTGAEYRKYADREYVSKSHLLSSLPHSNDRFRSLTLN